MSTLSHRIIAVAAIALLSACASKDSTPQRAMTFSAPEQPSTTYVATPADQMSATVIQTPQPMAAPAPAAQSSYSQSSASTDRSTSTMPGSSYDSSSSSMSNQRDSMTNNSSDSAFERAPRADRN